MRPAKRIECDTCKIVCDPLPSDDKFMAVGKCPKCGAIIGEGYYDDD